MLFGIVCFSGFEATAVHADGDSPDLVAHAQLDWPEGGGVMFGSVKDHANDAMPVVGSGPFVLTEHVAGQFIKLRANKTYWRGAPKVDELLTQAADAIF